MNLEHRLWPKSEFLWPKKNTSFNLTLRSALDECFHCSSTSGEMYEHENSIKIELEGDTINTVKNLWYTYSSIRVVEVIVLTRILDHLMRQIAISDGWIN